MTVKEILTPLIQQELRKYEQSGHKIRLKTQQNNRIGYTVGCAAVGALLFPLLPITAILLMIVCNDKKFMGKYANKTWNNVLGILLLAVLVFIAFRNMTAFVESFSKLIAG